MYVLIMRHCIAILYMNSAQEELRNIVHSAYIQHCADPIEHHTHAVTHVASWTGDFRNHQAHLCDMKYFDAVEAYRCVDIVANSLMSNTQLLINQLQDVLARGSL